MTLAALKLDIPTQHHSNLDAELAKADPASVGSIIGILQKIIAWLKAAGVAIDWTKIIALIPLIVAALANPATGLWPLIQAIIALFTPTPVPVPTP